MLHVKGGREVQKSFGFNSKNKKGYLVNLGFEWMAYVVGS